MNNVFHKCLKRAFGEQEYIQYVEMCREELVGQDPGVVSYENKPVYQKMYRILRQENQENLKERAERLMETMYQAFQIGHRFASVILFYVIANFVLIGLELDYYVTCVSLALVGVCFLYKLVEFMKNKYCFVDAYLVMVYKAVLEQLYPALKNGA